MLTALRSFVDPVLTGVATGLQFNPMSAGIAAVLAAALVGYRGATRAREWISVLVLLLGWAAGDGVRVVAASAAPVYLALWAVSGFAVGYVTPVLFGAYVGRRVVRGTGWLSAGAVALMLVPALSLLCDAISGAIWRVVA